MLIFYASPGGTGNGSPQSPASITAVKTLAAANAASDEVTICLKDGVYTLQSPLVFTSADSGQNGHTVTWQAATESDKPILSGGSKVTGWSLYDAGKNIWRATVPQGTVCRQMYVNGERATRSRMLAGTSFYSDSYGAYYQSSDPAIPVFSHPADLELLAAAQPWSMNRCAVNSVSRSGNLTTIIPDSAIQWWNGIRTDYPFPPYLYAIENAYEFLAADTLGCWCLDSAAAALYYVPRTGENMATADVVLPVVETLVQASQSDPPSNIVFNGITFAETGWTLPTTQKSFLQIQAGIFLPLREIEAFDDYEQAYYTTLGYAWTDSETLGQPPAAVQLYGAEHITFDKCVFTRLGGRGVHIGKGSKYCTITRSTLADISGNAISIGEILDGNPALADRSSFNAVTLNQINNVGVEYQGSVAIFRAYADNNIINHNEISDLFYTAISLGYGWSSQGYSFGNEIAYNKIHDIMTLLTDGGAVYSLGYQGSNGQPEIVHDNYIFNIAQTTARAARIDSYGLYSDQGSDYINYYNNVIVCANNWFYSNVRPGDTVDGGLSAWDNFASSGWTGIRNNGDATSTINIAAPTALEGTDPYGWPATAQAIAAAAGTGETTAAGAVLPLAPARITPTLGSISVLGKQTGSIPLSTAHYQPAAGPLALTGVAQTSTGVIPMSSAVITVKAGSLTVTGVSTGSGTGIRSPDGRLLVLRNIYGQPVNLNIRNLS
jgi:hypothetical protein